MSKLADHFCKLNAGTGDPFIPLTVVTQSHGMGQWLKIRYANHLGIAANIECTLPAHLLWQLYRELIPGADQLETSPFDRSQLTWHLFNLLEKSADQARAVRHYLEGPGDGDLRRFQLSKAIATQFDEYLMYRPAMMLAWKEGKTSTEDPTEPWQSALWRQVLARLPENQGLHRAALHQQVLDVLCQDTPQLPWHRISVFGMSSMPPMQLETFAALAQHIDVDIFFMNPCEHYWGDIVSTKEKARSIRQRLTTDRALIDQDYLEVGNPLLASFGKQGREFLELLLETEQVQTIDLFEPVDVSSRLDHVKADILEMTHGGAFESDESPTSSPLNDDSIQIHSCHNRLREVEVLRDSILKAFSDMEGLQSHEIMVMAPNIDLYAPHIHAVFGEDFQYRLSDHGTVDNSPLLASFLWLLQLPASRLTAPDILDLVETPAVMNRFEIDSEDFELLHYWIRGSNIRWEIDGDSKQQRWQVPAENQNTWKFGLDRLALGFAMSDRDGDWLSNFPFEISPAEAPLLGKLIRIVNLLSDYRNRIDETRSPEDWQSLLTQLISDFFAPDKSELIEMDSLIGLLEEVSAQAALAHHDEPVSYQLMHHIISQSLEDNRSTTGFVSGGLTFATLVPMRSVPYRMVCLLGINDGEFPRDHTPPSFDLIANNGHARGDRSRKIDDRYLFLEAILSAQDRFHVSFLGRGNRDNKVYPPAGVLGELREYLEEIFDDFTVYDHPLQPFSERYFEAGGLFSYSRPWYESLTSDRPDTEPLPGDATLELTSLTQLERFFQHPARYFLAERMLVQFNRLEEETERTETFELDALMRYQVTGDALNELVNGRSLDEFERRIQGQGLLMPGPVGRTKLIEPINLAIGMHTKLEDLLADEVRPVTGELHIDGETLSLHINQRYGDTLLSYRPGDLRADVLLASWIRHLAVNALGEPTRSELVFVSRGKVQGQSIAPVDATTALELLTPYLSYYRLGTSQPVFMPADTCRALSSSLKDMDQQSALEEARLSWLDAQEKQPERYWQRLFDDNPPFDDDLAVRASLLWDPIHEAIANA